MALPSWRYEIEGIVIEQSIVVPSRQTSCIRRFARSATMGGSGYG
jgi:hypothetical protein